MIWLPKYYASLVGVPCCHCRMDKKELFQKALRFHTKKIQDKFSVGNTLPEKNGLNQNKQKRKKFFLPDYGRLECVTLPNHLYSHSSRSVPSISYM